VSELNACRRTVRIGFEATLFVVPVSDERAPSPAWIFVRGLQEE
jgi:hypothetical protein